MRTISRLTKYVLKEPPDIQRHPVLSIPHQIKAWRKANRRMGRPIGIDELNEITVRPPPEFAENEEEPEIGGTGLFYGFGADGSDVSDAVLSGKLAWEYACSRRKGKTWQCEYIDFNKPDDIRLRPGAPPRPKGFYFAQVRLGVRSETLTVNQLRKTLEENTGFGPEGFQLLGITHPHIADLMNERKIPNMALADYDVAPYGFNDFYDAPQLFCSNGILGLGIGNLDRNYPLFGIPTLRLATY